MEMKTSKEGIEGIKGFEKFMSKAYKCPAGVWTIGWGHTGGVKAGQKTTQAEADQMLVNDMAAYEKKVNKYAAYGWNQNEFDALTSFAYNVGNIDQLTVTMPSKLFSKQTLHFIMSITIALNGVPNTNEQVGPKDHIPLYHLLVFA